MLRIKVSGMSCAHCAAHVKEALEALPGARKVDVDLKRGEAVVDGEVPYDLAASAIQEEGYTAEPLT